MESYKSYIDGHAISCAPLPTFNKGYRHKDDGHLALCGLPIQGSGQPTHDFKRVRVSGKVTAEKFFYLGKNFEYFDGKLSLTKFLLDIHKTYSKDIKVQIDSKLR